LGTPRENDICIINSSLESYIINYACRQNAWTVWQRWDGIQLSSWRGTWKEAYYSNSTMFPKTTIMGQSGHKYRRSCESPKFKFRCLKTGANAMLSFATPILFFILKPAHRSA